MQGEIPCPEDPVVNVSSDNRSNHTNNYKQRLNKTDLPSFYIILYKISAINILTAKQSLFLSIITIFFGTTGNLLAGTKRKEKLWHSKRLHTSQNLRFTQITTDVQDPSQAAGTEEVNQPPGVT